MSEYFSWRSSGEGMPADHFGYWTFQWASDSASSFLDSLLDQPQEGWSLQKAIDQRPFPTLLRLTAFFTVPYWLYALDELKVSKEVMAGMQRGMSAGIGDISDSDGVRLSKESEDAIRSAFKSYLAAEREERLLVLAAGTETAELKVGKIAALLASDLYRLYGETSISTPQSLDGDLALRQNLLASKTSIYEMLFRELELRSAN